MTLSDLSIKNSVFAWMLMLGLIFFGLISVSNMGISEMPDVDFPVVNVALTYEGASPEVMETDVIDIIEESVMTVEGIKSLSSTSKQEEGSVVIEFELNRDIDDALSEVQTKIAQAQKRLPLEMDPPIITKTNPEDQPIMWVALSGNKDSRYVMEYARNSIKDRLQTVAGVGEVLLSGFVDPTLRVWVKPDKLNEYELTVSDLLDAIGREHIEIPAGRIETSLKEINVRTLGETLTPEEFSKLLITHRGGQPIYKPIPIGEVAEVVKGLDDVRRISRTQGNAAVGLGIKKQRGSNAVEVANGIRKRMEEIKSTLPEGLNLWVNFDATQFIRNTTSEMKFDLILSVFLTAFVCLLFLASWGSTVNVLLAIPTSIIGSFIILNFFGFTLNTFTFLGLILSIGIVVDDAIMVLENIVRHQEMGKSALRAALDGAKEITPAAVATTLAIIAIFLPVVFMKGIIGKFFFQFGVTMAVTVGLSLLEAITITPMRASRLGGSNTQHDGWLARFANGFFGKLSTRYKKMLRVCLNHRLTVVFISLCVFGLSLFFLGNLKKEFVPAQDQSAFLVRFQTPLGSSIDFTDKKMREAEEITMKSPEVLRYFSAVGGFGGGDVNTGMMFVTLKAPKERPKDEKLGHRLSQTEVMDRLREQFKPISDFMVFFQDLSTRGFTAQRGFPVEFTVRGPDWQTLVKTSDSIVSKMRSESNYFVDVDTDYKEGQPEIQVTPRRDAIAAHQVTMEEVGTTIQALIGGVKKGKITENGRRNDIRIRLGDKDRQTVDDIKKILVRNSLGELVPMGDLVEMKEVSTLKSITRKDRERAITIYSNVNNATSSQDKAIKRVEALAQTELPSGYRVVLSGSAETFRESFQSLLFVLYLGLVVAYMVLASQYDSFLHPILVLLALPFSISGAFIALAIMGSSLNIYSFIGIILLMGIAKKNSILLVDFTNQIRKKGLGVTEALMESSPQRLRPILMTSFATIAAAIPPAISLGAGSETRKPMAIVVIGGMLLSTLLTLFVVPCAYSLMSRFEKKKPNMEEF